MGFVGLGCLWVLVAGCCGLFRWWFGFECITVF